MRLARLAAAGIAATLLAGCAWLGWGDQSRKPMELTPIKASVTPKAAWTVSVGKSTPFTLTPVAAGGRIYAASAEGVVTVIEEENGRQAARFETSKKISGGVALEDKVLILGTLKGDVLAYDPAGKLLWSVNLAGEVLAPASVSRGVAVVRTSDGRLYGLTLADGKRKWVYQRPAPALLLRTDVGVLAAGGDVVAGFAGGKLIALDIDDGKLTWEVSVALPRGATELERIADVAGIPTIDGGRICAAAFQGKVACFEIQTRNLSWARDLSSARSIAMDGKNAYVIDDASAVHALDKSSGASVWKQDKLGFRKLTAPVIVNGNVVVGDGFGYLHVLAPQDGAMIGRLATDGSAVTALVPSTKGLVVQTANGAVMLVTF